jgi:hypothetical protein
MKQVTCNGKLFEIDQLGRRVWLECPPPDVEADIRHDQRFADWWEWNRFWREDCEE